MTKKTYQRKPKLCKQVKRYAITGIMILFLASIGFIVNEVMQEELIEETQVMSSFTNTPGVSYQVYLKENEIFNDKIQPEDLGYFSSLIDHIEITFDNQYQGESGAMYEGDYTIKGEIIGWQAGTDTPVPAWTKQFNISTKRNFETTDKELLLSQNVNLDFNHFNSFVARVTELTGYKTSCTMKVMMIVNYKITTTDGEVTGTLQPSLTMPLEEKYFTIQKSDNTEMKNDITKTVELAAPYDYGKMILLSTISLLCLIALLLLFNTSEPTLTDLQRSRIMKMLKAHGNRIVAIEMGMMYSGLKLCCVHTMNDMVKISDEIERPIFYVYQEDPADICEFFIVDKDTAYVYKANTSAKPDDPQEPREEADNKIAS
ncbi:hypothetical protein FRZ06_05455 [Anoxybacterium hadale]|uniref:Uncharacterized protein n=1 Tax=Anoxybacterium hadale TaxID=3408580 RepID=A0ACD1A8W5_9FIRM|nr:hypothetical protein FRZ06_05455 [Clostridiales bacterium]